MTQGKGSTADPGGTGYFMPAEWEPHEATWLQWPSDDVEPGYEMKHSHTWLQMVAALCSSEDVNIITRDTRQRDHVAYLMDYFGICSRNVNLFVLPHDDVWVRDNGPIFVFDDQGKLAITNWSFNGWGNRFPYELDNRVPEAIGNKLEIPVIQSAMVLEGGAVEVNGQGTFMATRSSIIDPYRNPGQNQMEIETTLNRYLGANHFIWLSGAGRGECERWGDTTDSHIDIIARFTSGSTVLYNQTDDQEDPRYEMLRKIEAELRESTDETGKPLTLVALPLPKDRVYQVAKNSSWRESSISDAAYSNFLVANGVVLVPVFGNIHDERAKKIIGEQFPDREIVGIDAVSLTEDGGAIHCVTQQQPAKRQEVIHEAQ